MKNYSLFIGLVTAALLLAYCEKDNTAKSTLRYVETTLGGCNGDDRSKSGKTVYSETLDILDDRDTVMFSIESDTLNAFVGVNYLCCTPFVSSCEMVKDTIVMTVKDNCTNIAACYCKCMCYYTFNFRFVDFESKAHFYYKVLLYDPKQNKTSIFSRGEINIGK